MALKDAAISFGLKWRDEYDELSSEFIKRHFGGSAGITALFPYMKSDFKLRTKSDDYVNERHVLKNNNEYHGLERHAKQYHANALHEEAYHHWLIAAVWRLETMTS